MKLELNQIIKSLEYYKKNLSLEEIPHIENEIKKIIEKNKVAKDYDLLKTVKSWEETDLYSHKLIDYIEQEIPEIKKQKVKEIIKEYKEYLIPKTNINQAKLREFCYKLANIGCKIQFQSLLKNVSEKASLNWEVYDSHDYYRDCDQVTINIIEKIVLSNLTPIPRANMVELIENLRKIQKIKMLELNKSTFDQIIKTIKGLNLENLDKTEQISSYNNLVDLIDYNRYKEAMLFSSKHLSNIFAALKSLKNILTKEISNKTTEIRLESISDLSKLSISSFFKNDINEDDPKILQFKEKLEKYEESYGLSIFEELSKLANIIDNLFLNDNLYIEFKKADIELLENYNFRPLLEGLIDLNNQFRTKTERNYKSVDILSEVIYVLLDWTIEDSKEKNKIKQTITAYSQSKNTQVNSLLGTSSLHIISSKLGQVGFTPGNEKNYRLTTFGSITNINKYYSEE